MVALLSAGHARPAGIIDDRLLAELSSDPWSPSPLSGIAGRATVLPIEYLKATANADRAAAIPAGGESPTDLAMIAAHMALSRDGLAGEQLGLVIGEGATPYELTPSEGQRVAGKLGIKVPSYDVSGAAAAFSLHASTLVRWKPERLPVHTLTVTSNTPTRCVNYRGGSAREYFGDGAACALFGNGTGRGFEVVGAEYRTDRHAPDSFELPTYAHLTMEEEPFLRRIRELAFEAAAAAMERHALTPRELILVPGVPSARSASEIGEQLGIPPARVWTSSLVSHGYALGSTALIELALRWAEVGPNDILLVIESGPGLSSGYVVLRA